MDLPSAAPDSDDLRTANEFELKDYRGEDVRRKEPKNHEKEEEPIYVAVKDSEDGELFELPCNPDKTLSLTTLSHSFPGATGLKFQNPKTGASRVVIFDPTRSLFMCPADGWENQIFTATYPPPPQSRANKEEEEEPIYVAVKDSEDGELFELPCNPDKTLSLTTLSHSFPGATGLKFQNPKTGASRVVIFDPTRSLFMCPADGWENQIFTATYPPRANKGEDEKQIYVNVKGSQDGKPCGLPCNPDKTLSLITLLQEFPGATGLKFKDPKTAASRVVIFDSTRSLFICPADGWKNQIFTATYPPPPESRVIRIKMMGEGTVAEERKVDLSENVITQNTVKNVFLLPADSVITLRYGDNAGAKWCDLDSTGSSFLLPEGWPTMEFFVDSRSKGPANRASKILNDWEDRVFCIEGRGGAVGSCVLLDNKRILTSAHLSFKRGEWYPIKRPGLEGIFEVRCDFICLHLDFAVLSSEALQDLPMSIDNLGLDSNYFIMGYPNGVEASKPTITRGIIKGLWVDGKHLVGTPGSKRGYSGAPVFDDTGRLAGLLMGGTTGLDVNTNIQECLESSVEQKYAKILGSLVITQLYDSLVENGISDEQS